MEPNFKAPKLSPAESATGPIGLMLSGKDRTMTDAPERIWASFDSIGQSHTSFASTYFGKCHDGYAGMSYATEYIRKDVSDAAVKVAAKDGYTAGRQDAQVLCNLWFAGTNTSAPDLLGKDQDNE